MALKKRLEESQVKAIQAKIIESEHHPQMEMVVDVLIFSAWTSFTTSIALLKPYGIMAKWR